MNQEHVIQPSVLQYAAKAFENNHHWLTYNTLSYFLDKQDVYFFKDQDEALEFAANNISDYDLYNVTYARTVEELLKQILINQKLSTMNEKNLDYLKDNMKYMGFGDSMNEALETHLKHGQPEFRISHQTVVNKKPFEVELHFRKSDNTDMYFFNSYNASLQRSNGEKVDQTFYLNKGKGITAKEAYNLLEGRAVHKELTTKEGQEYKAWVQLDFDKMDKHNNHEVKQFHENYGYDLRAAVEKFAVTDLLDTDKEKALMQSLQKGNVQSVTIEKDGQVSKMFLEANPQFKMVTLYDAQMKRVPKEDLGQYQSVKQTENKEVSQEQKEDIKKDVKQKKSEDLNGTKKKSSRKKGQSV